MNAKLRRAASLSCGRALGADVKIFGHVADHEVAHATADEVGGEAGFLQVFDQADCMVVDEFPAQSWLLDFHFGDVAFDFLTHEIDFALKAWACQNPCDED